MAKRSREVGGLNIALLDILTGALGAVIILFVAVPKGTQGDIEAPKAPVSIIEEDVSQLHAEIKSQVQEIKKLQKIVLETQGKNKQLEQRGEESEKKIKALRKFASKIEKETETKAGANYRGKGLPVDVGFKFKGKKIVFVIDVSGSMVREDRIGQVKAGLKMLITSMPADYQLDVISR
jgi:septal ring factor EnvC (AmiA/AmiB activator)